MCGRVFVKSTFAELMRAFSAARRSDNLSDLDAGPRFNGAPSLVYPIIVADSDQSAFGVFTDARWGLVPSWSKDIPQPALAGRGRPAWPKVAPANARCETLKANGMFRGAYRARRCLVPVDGYFEWKAIKGAKVKQPYALAMKDGRPFCLGGIWEERRAADTGETSRTFAVVTCKPNDLVATIHDRMPLILHPEDYGRWLNPEEPDPSDLLMPFPAGLMRIWPVSKRVNKAGNEGADLIEPVEIETDADEDGGGQPRLL